MFKPFSLFVGTRYVRLKQRDHFITFISLISMLGIALGVMVLITVLSVMNGFMQEIRSRILSVTPHVLVSDSLGRPLQEWQPLAEQLKGVPQVEAAGPYIDGQGMITRGQAMRGVLVRGVEPDSMEAVFPLDQVLRQGTTRELLVPDQYGVILGATLAKSLHVQEGDKVTLVMPELHTSLITATPRLKRLTVVGIFEAGYLYDASVAFLHRQDAAQLFKMQGGASGIQLRLRDPFAAPKVVQELSRTLKGSYHITDWTTLNSTYFSAVKMEKTMMFFTLMMILAIAVFNLVSTLVMVVTDKQADIAVLRTLGASTRKIMSIFVCQGASIGLMGTLLGVASGILLATHVTTLVAAIERLFQVKFLAEEVYFISFLPSELQGSDVLLVASSALLLSLLATLHPAWRAARIQPAEALRRDL